MRAIFAQLKNWYELLKVEVKRVVIEEDLVEVKERKSLRTSLFELEAYIVLFVRIEWIYYSNQRVNTLKHMYAAVFAIHFWHKCLPPAKPPRCLDYTGVWGVGSSPLELMNMAHTALLCVLVDVFRNGLKQYGPKPILQAN